MKLVFMDLLQIVGTVVGIVVGLTGLFTFGASFWTARSGNQRALRERLRKQLREMNLACVVYFQREGWEAVNRSPQFSFQALDHIHQDGLISPSRSHIDWLKSILREVYDRSHLQLSRQALPPDEHAELMRTNERRLRRAFEILDSETEVYLRVLGKMDNTGIGGYGAYMRYRFIPPRLRDTFPTSGE